MERMRLTRIEVAILRTYSQLPPDYDRAEALGLAIRNAKDACSNKINHGAVVYAFKHLSDEGFLKATSQEGGTPVRAEVTPAGLAYIEEYPKMENLEDPLRSERFTKVVAILSLLISFASLLIAGIALWRQLVMYW